jgi:Flp pilus assembly pilin Flp
MRSSAPVGGPEYRKEVGGVLLRMALDYVTLGWARLEALGFRVRAPASGQSMVEYAIVAALIAVVAMAAVQALGGGIAQVFQNILTRIQSIGTS